MTREIRQGDLVVVVLKVEEEEKEEKNRFEWGFVKAKCADSTEKPFLIETDIGDSWHSKDELYSYARTKASNLRAEYCHPQIMLQIIAEKLELERQLETLQEKIIALESNLGSISMGLGTTQEELRLHLLGPH